MGGTQSSGKSATIKNRLHLGIQMDTQMQSDSNRITEEELAEIESKIGSSIVYPSSPKGWTTVLNLAMEVPRLIAEVRRLRVALETVTKKTLMVSMDGQTMPLADYEKFLRGHDVGNTSIPAVTNPADGECGGGESK